MERSRVTELHYITPVANLESIVELGILSHRGAAGVSHASIADEEVQDRRRDKRVPNGRMLHEYVNVYFDARNPMMYKRHNHRAKLTVIRIRPGVLDIQGAVITDGNAASIGTRFDRSPDGLALLDEKRVFAEYWTEVQLGRPYAYKADDHMIVNFPTKNHWRAVSRLEDIEAGLNYLKSHYREWGITSIAVPPLGCGHGQLEWEVVGPTLYRHLSQLGIPVEMYAPHGESPEPTQLALGGSDDAELPTRTRHVKPEWVTLIAILDRLERQPHHWPVGRVMFQKLVYFATQAGIPTGLDYEAASYGPYAADVNRMVARLQNNGLAIEQQRGNMFEVRVGPTYRDAVDHHRERMQAWRPAVVRTVDLMSRMNTQTAEVAASVHFTAVGLQRRYERRPSAFEVVDAVEEWKIRRRPPLTRESIIQGLIVLALRGWIDVELDAEFKPLVEKFVFT